jgi:uncharacterized protein (DUF2147 family)
MEKMATVLFSLLLVANVPSTSSGVRGTWKTVDDRTGKVVSEVQLYEQGNKLFGKITALAEPDNARARPKVCTKCKGEDRDRPIVGLVIIRDLGLDGERYKGGTLLDPADGKVYKAELWAEEGKLKVRGYGGPLEKTQTWVR